MSYFAIERNGEWWSPVLMHNNGDVDFSDFMNMAYDEMKSDDRLAEFVAAAMDATNAMSDTDDDQTVVTLIGEDDIFIWSIIMGPDEDGNIAYVLVDWKKDGKSYKYEN